MGVLWGKIGEGVMRYWPLTNSFFLLGVLTSLPILVKIDQEMRPWECSQTDRQIHRLTVWQIHWQTQTDFIICPMLYAIAMGQIKIYTVFKLQKERHIACRTLSMSATYSQSASNPNHRNAGITQIACRAHDRRDCLVLALCLHVRLLDLQVWHPTQFKACHCNSNTGIERITVAARWSWRFRV